MNTPEVITFGELLWDLLPSGPILGGAPANVAYRLAAFGLPVALISRVGDDELGRKAVDILKTRGLDTSGIQLDSQKKTGTVAVSLSDAGDATYEIYRDVAYDYIQPTDSFWQKAHDCRAICFGTLVQRSPAAKEALYSLISHSNGALKVLDVNLRKDCFDSDSVRHSLEVADVIKLNTNEVGVVSELLNFGSLANEEFAKVIFENFKASLILVTQGSNGVVAYSKDGETVEIPGKKIKVADTVGSGDNFTAGFLYKYLSGASLKESCTFANAVASLVASKPGGMPEISDAEIKDALTI